MELVLKESTVVVEHREATGTADDTGKVVVGTERRPHMDKESMVYGPYELSIEEHLSVQHLFLIPSSFHNYLEASWLQVIDYCYHW